MSGRFAPCVSCPSAFALVAAVGFCCAGSWGASTAQAAGCPAAVVDAEELELEELAGADLREPASEFEQLVFRRDSANPEFVSRRLETLLQQRIDAVSRGFRLSESQARSLELAGRGDIRRFLERVETARRQVQGIRWNAQKLNAEAAPLRRAFMTGPFADDSLFGKVMPNVLTTEQLQICGAVQAVERAGGRIKLQQDWTNELIEVRLTGVTVEDDALVALRSVTALEILYLDATRVTDAGLVSLSGLKKLRILDLSFSSVTGPGLAHLQGLTNLRVLNLGGTQISGAHLVHLDGLPHLRKLDLERTNIGDDGIAHLRGLKALEILNLGLTEVTDAGLAELGRQNHPRLAHLSVNDTKVSDAGLEHVKGLAGLKWLDLGRTDVTDEGVAKLKRALPDLNIHR